MSRLNGEITIVTADCGGIGRAVVELFAAESTELVVDSGYLAKGS
jgi:NAD(P)-dependent dehydrogenase (short-subunit alcohol dehydrogenase family)